MEKFFYIIFITVFINAFFMFYTLDTYLKRLETGLADITLLIFSCLFFLVIMMCGGFIFARLAKH